MDSVNPEEGPLFGDDKMPLEKRMLIHFGVSDAL